MTGVSQFGNTVFQNAELLYDTLFAKSEIVTADKLVPYGYPSDGPSARVFYGLAIRVSAEVGLQKSAHGHAMTLLKSMQAVDNLKTGNHSIPSIYVLNYRPTREQFDKFKADNAQTSDRISPTKFNVLKHDLSDARVRIKSLEKSLATSSDRIELLESALKDLQTQFFDMRDALERK